MTCTVTAIKDAGEVVRLAQLFTKDSFSRKDLVDVASMSGDSFLDAVQKSSSNKSLR